MNKITLLLAVLALSSLVACNSSDTALEVTPVEIDTPSAESTTRNMAVDVGNIIQSPDGIDVPAGEQASNLIDGDINSKFLSFSTSVTIIFEAQKAYLLKSYNIVSANDQPNRDPLLWTLEGSNNKETWSIIDTQSDQTFSGRGTRNSYELVNNETAFQYYRFSFTHTGTDDFGANITQIAEIELLVTADLPIVTFMTDVSKAGVGEPVNFFCLLYTSDAADE